MPNVLEKIVKFCQVTPVQQIGSLLMAPIIIDALHSSSVYYSNGDFEIGTASLLVAIPCIGTLLFNEGLAAWKYQEYNRVKSILEKKGWDERVIETQSYSWCQRNAVQVASNDTGYRAETKNYLHDRGYRWYNFIPDFKGANKSKLN